MFEIRHPTLQDGAALWRLAEASRVLDLNSSYAYLILSHHHSKTCAIAVDGDGTPAGFATAYRLPERPETLFLWQITTAEGQRKRGLAKQMLMWLLAQPSCEGVTHFETTVTPSNGPSKGLFGALSQQWDTPLSVHPFIGAEHFPVPGHEPEELVRLGPLSTSKTKECYENIRKT